MFGLILCAFLGAEEVELSAMESQMIVSINSERLSRGLTELVPDAALMNATRAHCEWMASNSKLSHARNCGRENIAMTSNANCNQCINMWMNSSGHRKNLLSNGTRLGVACYVKSSGRAYYCYRIQ